VHSNRKIRDVKSETLLFLLGSTLVPKNLIPGTQVPNYGPATRGQTLKYQLTKKSLTTDESPEPDTVYKAQH
jgi:hypothetical protein